MEAFHGTNKTKVEEWKEQHIDRMNRGAFVLHIIDKCKEELESVTKEDAEQEAASIMKESFGEYQPYWQVEGKLIS